MKKLRDQTGAGMMDCKAALEEANGDFEEATTILRKKGPGERRQEGRTRDERRPDRAPLSADHSSGILVEVNCESDFVARTDDFQQLVQRRPRRDRAGRRRGHRGWLRDPNGPVHLRVAAGIGKLGENMAVPRFVRYAGQGYVGQYIHMGGKIGVQVEFGGVTPAVAGRDEFATLVKEIAMQIAAASPAYVVARRGARRRARQGAGHLPRPDGELGQAGERHRQDRRGQARQLLLAGRAARPGVDPRSEDDRGRRRSPRRQGAGRSGHGDPVRAAEGRRGRVTVQSCSTGRGLRHQARAPELGSPTSDYNLAP